MDNAVVADYWGHMLPEKERTLYGFPPTRAYIYRLVTGETHDTVPPDALERWSIETFLGDRRPVARALSLCCGFGAIERRLASYNAFTHCLGVDLSPGAIEAARQQAQAEGLTQLEYAVTDINQISLEPESFDLIYANGALHHLSNLEHVIGQIQRALKPGGVLISNEYTGPKYQRLSDRQAEIISAAIHLLPDRLRPQDEVNRAFTERIRHVRGLRKVLRAYKKGLSWVDQRLGIAIDERRFGQLWHEQSRLIQMHDPSEGVRADEIIPILRQTFPAEKLDIRPYNGGLLLHVLSTDFFDHYDPARDRALVDLLIELEERLTAAGELNSDHAHIIAHK